MPSLNRTYWRAAQRIGAALRASPESFSFALPRSGWAALQTLERQLAHGQQRGWTAAARAVRDTTHLRLRWLICDLQALLSALPPPSSELEPHVGEIYRDLVALSSRFDDVQVDLAQQELSVTTESITLEEIELGPFRLIWNWTRLDEDRALRVVAEEPHPAVDRPDVTHPHVQDERLCTGDAHQPLRRALLSGRILDYFEIVERVLTTYNSSSPYVSLDEWEGRHCAGCGLSVCTDELGGCEDCDNDFCGDCRTSCDHCGCGLCGDCSVACGRCGRTLCGDCRHGAPSHPLCPKCFTKENADEETTIVRPDVAPADAAVHADGLGQVDLLAGCGADGDRRLRSHAAG